MRYEESASPENGNEVIPSQQQQQQYDEYEQRRQIKDLSRHRIFDIDHHWFAIRLESHL